MLRVILVTPTTLNYPRDKIKKEALISISYVTAFSPIQRKISSKRVISHEVCSHFDMHHCDSFENVIRF